MASAEAQVGEALRFMQGQDVVDGFQFKDHRVVDNNFCPVTTVERGAIMDQRQIDLPRIGDRVPIELVTEAVFVGVFEQALGPAVCARASPGRWCSGSGCRRRGCSCCVFGCAVKGGMIGVGRFIRR